jgi:hypothetical protein
LFHLMKTFTESLYCQTICTCEVLTEDTSCKYEVFTESH